jgi:hypothetical protein
MSLIIADSRKLHQIFPGGTDGQYLYCLIFSFADVGYFINVFAPKFVGRRYFGFPIDDRQDDTRLALDRKSVV